MATTSPGPGTPDDQADVVAFLDQGHAFERTRPTRIDTHCASIFLVGDRAWKLKRAVRFGYLDFSTFDKRHAALEAELRLNRRTAPDLYLALHPITREAGGRLAIDAPVTWSTGCSRCDASPMMRCSSISPITASSMSAC
ncbi:hypothetical protein [Sphingobium sp. Ant17]|uniref:hypothetical protein n=1 Tax=Sphingobium sp. Ant17 TaxID=1461752 RepID=UPI0004B96F43|nr:hypothetical protein [Sphingobium sp. Ant17]